MNDALVGSLLEDDGKVGKVGAVPLGAGAGDGVGVDSIAEPLGDGTMVEPSEEYSSVTVG